MKTRNILRLSFIIAATVSVLGVVFVPPFFRAREEYRKAVCFSNLKQIGLAMEIYAKDFGGRFPPSLKQLVPDYVTRGQEGIFHCDSDRTHGPSYVYVPGFTTKDRPMTMVVIERGDIHEGGRHVLFIDTHVMRLQEARFQELWAKQREEFKLPSLKDLGDTVEESR